MKAYLTKTETEPAPGQQGATELATTGSPVVVGAAAPPVAGQLLRASGATSAAWVNPGGLVGCPIGIESWTLGSTPPTTSTVGTTPTVPALRFDAVDETVALSLVMPPEWDHGDVFLDLVFALTTTETDSTTADFTLDYTASQELSTGTGPAKTSTQLTDSVTVTTGNGLAAGDLYRAGFTLDAGDATNPLAAATVLSLEWHLTNVTGVAAIDFIGAIVRFQSTVSGAGSGGSGGLTFVAAVAANTTISVGERQAYDASGGTFTLSAPTSPNPGDEFGILEDADDGTDITISGNGETIWDPVTEALVSSFDFGGAGISLHYLYTGAGWRLV